MWREDVRPSRAWLCSSVTSSFNTIEDDPNVAVGHAVPEQILRLAQPGGVSRETVN